VGCGVIAGLGDFGDAPATGAGAGGGTSTTTSSVGGNAGSGGAGGTSASTPAILQVAASSGSTCVAVDDGSVWCWGRNDHGQLGEHPNTSATCPDGVACRPRPARQVPGLPPVNGVCGGDGYACAWGDGRAWCWGRNDVGQLGTDPSMTPEVCSGIACSDTPIEVAVSDVRRIACGVVHTCALHGDGTVSCWGNSRFGQLGRGIIDDAVYPPGKVTGLSDVDQLVVANHHRGNTCAITSNGDLWCWGSNHSAELGHPLNTEGDEACGAGMCKSTPGQVSTDEGGSSFGGVAAMKPGQGHMCVSQSNGSLWCWGGKTWENTVLDRAVNRPVQVVPSADASNELWGIDQLVGSTVHTCAIAANMRAYCWGSNQNGKMGIDTLAGEPLSSLSGTGGAGGSILSGNGGTGGAATELVCGTGQPCWRNPVAVSLAEDLDAIWSFGPHMIVRSTDGRLFGWGANGHGQLGEEPVATTACDGGYCVPTPLRARPRWAVPRLGALATPLRKAAVGGGKSLVGDRQPAGGAKPRDEPDSARICGWHGDRIV
jgi:alpha-tubulin suppressor-like RCC1 family protein